MLTEVMALEVAGYGTGVNALAPGCILTRATSMLLEGKLADGFARAIPLRRFGEFDDLDGPLLLLVSTASRYMTGALITIDGGHAGQRLTIGRAQPSQARRTGRRRRRGGGRRGELGWTGRPEPGLSTSDR